jgi:hypothetical protein
VETPQKCKDATTLNLNSGNSFMEICFWIFGFLDFWIFGFLDFWVIFQNLLQNSNHIIFSNLSPDWFHSTPLILAARVSC